MSLYDRRKERLLKFSQRLNINNIIIDSCYILCYDFSMKYTWDGQALVHQLVSVPCVLSIFYVVLQKTAYHQVLLFGGPYIYFFRLS